MKSQIKTWQEAFAAKGMNPEIMPDVSMLPEAYRKQQLALYKLHVVAEVINDGWKPDYTNLRQWKYFPWFRVEASKENPSGFGLSFNVCAYWYSFSGVGVRLCFKSEEIAEYVGKQFIDLYQDLFLY